MKPRGWKQGDPISASRLNGTNAEAGRSRRQSSTGTGSSMVNETMGNQSHASYEAGTRLVRAKEDFAPSDVSTDIYGLNDPQYSGKCMMMRLVSSGNAPSGLYEEEVFSQEFRVWDPIALLSSTASKSEGDVFYTVYNKDSKRWEVLTTGASQNLRHAIVCDCVGHGWYVMEFVDSLPSAPPDCDPSCASTSASASNDDYSCSSSASNNGDPCSLCDLSDLECQCSSPGTFNAERDAGIGNGTFVYAYDKRTVPLKIGGAATIAWLGDICDAASASASASASDSTVSSNLLYTVLNGDYELVTIPHDLWECCPIEGIKKVACYTFIVEGVMCIGPIDPCDSASASASV